MEFATCFVPLGVPCQEVSMERSQNKANLKFEDSMVKYICIGFTGVTDSKVEAAVNGCRTP